MHNEPPPQAKRMNMALFKTFGSDDMLEWTEDKRRKYMGMRNKCWLFGLAALAVGPVFNSTLWHGSSVSAVITADLILATVSLSYWVRCRRMEK